MIISFYNYYMFLYILIPLIISIMLYTLAERKIQALVQHRIGPNQVGIYGLLQPLTDGLKLLLKEIIIPQPWAKVLVLRNNLGVYHVTTQTD